MCNTFISFVSQKRVARGHRGRLQATTNNSGAYFWMGKKGKTQQQSTKTPSLVSACYKCTEYPTEGTAVHRGGHSERKPKFEKPSWSIMFLRTTIIVEGRTSLSLPSPLSVVIFLLLFVRRCLHHHRVATAGFHLGSGWAASGIAFGLSGSSGSSSRNLTHRRCCCCFALHRHP